MLREIHALQARLRLGGEATQDGRASKAVSISVGKTRGYYVAVSGADQGDCFGCDLWCGSAASCLSFGTGRWRGAGAAPSIANCGNEGVTLSA